MCDAAQTSKAARAKTLDDIKGRCVVDTITGCWVFKGARSDGRYTRIWAPDYNKGGAMAALPGKRAVWYAMTGKPIPQGHRVYTTCNSQDCVNPDHMACGTPAEWGKHLTSSGLYQGAMTRKVASRRTGAARSVLTPETFMEVITSTETGRDAARRMGISEQTVSKARRGHLKCFAAVASPFSGLGAR